MVQAGLKPGLFKMGKQIHYYTKKGLSIESLKKVFGWSFCDVWVHIPEINQSFVHLVEEDGGQKWFFPNGLLKLYKPGAKKPEYYSWRVVAGAIKLGEPDPAIELGGIY